MIPVISIVARKSNVGKTTILCKIIAELKKRKYRIGTIKHHSKGNIEVDKPEKDSWKHSQAGADVVVISSPKKIAIIETTEQEHHLNEILKKIVNVDIILTEGYKSENMPKIEILRKGVSEEIISKRDELLAIISDFEVAETIKRFDCEDIKEIVDFIENNFLLKKRK